MGYQHDLDIINTDADTGTEMRAAINLALKALGNLQSGDTAPTTTYANMFWADTTTGNKVLKMRNSANTAWITIGQLDVGYLGLLTLAFAQTITAQHTFSPGSMAPFTIGSSSQNYKVTGLNSDKCDGYDASATPAAGTSVVSDSDGKINKGWLRPKAVFKDKKTSGTGGGGSTAATWVQRALNTTEYNDITGCSLATNRITLPAGTYRIRASSPAYNVVSHIISLYNYTDSSYIGYGTSEKTAGTSSVNTRSFLDLQFVLASQKTVEIRHYCDNTVATTGFGVPISIANIDETYTVVELEKVV